MQFSARRSAAAILVLLGIILTTCREASCSLFDDQEFMDGALATSTPLNPPSSSAAASSFIRSSMSPSSTPSSSVALYSSPVLPTSVPPSVPSSTYAASSIPFSFSPPSSSSEYQSTTPVIYHSSSDIVVPSSGSHRPSSSMNPPSLSSSSSEEPFLSSPEPSPSPSTCPDPNTSKKCQNCEDCNNKLAIALGTSIPASILLTILAMIPFCIFCQRKKKKSAYIRMAPTVYFDEDDN